MDQPLLGDQSASALPTDLTLEDLKEYVESMSEDTNLESYLRSKLQKNHFAFGLPEGDEITAMCTLQDGFVAGLKSGKVMLISPPICEILEVHGEPIVGVFAASNFFVLIASAHRVKVWGLAQNAFLAQDDFPTAITCVAGNMVKEQIFIGLEDGSVEIYSMVGKNVGALQLKLTLQKLGEPSPVFDIKTNDSTTWLAIRYLSDELALWDHETNHLMYHFSFDGPPGLPNNIAIGEWKKLPAFFRPAEGWDVFPNLLILSSGLMIRMAGNSIGKMYAVRRILERDDGTWLAYSEALRKGYMPFHCHDFLISFTPPAAEKKKPSERNAQVQEIELDLGHFFTFAEKSEASNYIAFACEKSVEVYCLAALNSKFTHRPAGALAMTKSGEAVYARFSKLYNSKGEALKPMDQRELFEALSPDGKWVVTKLIARGESAPVQVTGELLPIRPHAGDAGHKRVGSMLEEGGQGKARQARGRGAGRFRRGNATKVAGREGRGGTQGPPAGGKAAEGERSPVLSICSTAQPVETVNLEGWAKKSFLQLKFSRNGMMLGLLFKEGLVIYSFEDRAIIREIPGEYTEKSYTFKNALNKAFILGGKNWYQAIYPVPSDTPVVNWPYTRYTFIKDEKYAPVNVLAYSLTKLALGQFSDNAFNPISAISTGFEKVKLLKSSTVLVATNDFGFHFYSLPDLRKLLHFEPGYSLTVSQDQSYVYALSSLPTSPSYGYIDVWDLDLGLKVQHTYSGLRHVVNNKLVVKGPGMWRDPDFASIATSHQSVGVLKETWAFDLGQFAQAGKTITKADMKDVTLNEEDVERHCMAWKLLVRMLSLGEMAEDVHSIVIRPFNINILHLLAHRSQASLLTVALENGGLITQSAFGTPLHIAIEQKSRASLDTLLKALISMREASPAAYLLSLYHMRDDLPSLVKDGSTILPEFMAQIIVPLPDQMCTQTVISPNAELPKEQLTDSMWVNSNDFDAHIAGGKTTVEYLVTPFPVFIDLGSKQSIAALEVLTSDDTDMNLFKALFIRTIVNLKWKQLWWFIFLSTVLYWVLLGIMIGITLHYFDHWAARGAFISLNTWFLLVEMLQASTSPREYVCEYWNYVDLTRTGLSYWWALSAFQPWVSFLVMLLSLLRGITTFQTFDATRFYVRMIFVVTHETLSFIWVFFYSTLSFGLLFATVNPDEAHNFLNTWMIPYELNMGNFDVHDKGSWYWMVFMAAALVNVIIMLNLVVSILGDAFDKFQSIAEAADILGKAEVLYEYERMMWWRRESGRRQFLQICRPEGQSEGVNEWTGKVEEIKKELKKAEVQILAKMHSSLKAMKAIGEDTSSTDRILTTLTEIRNEFNEKISAVHSESKQDKIAQAAPGFTSLVSAHLPSS